MRPLPLRFHTRPTRGQLADMLTEWLKRTPYAREVEGVQLPSDRDEAVATFSHQDRTFEVRLHPGGPPDLWLLEASTRVAPEEPSRSWSALLGGVIALLGIVLSLRWLTIGVLPFLLGIVFSLILGGLAAGMAWSRTIDRHTAVATREAGGQGSAQTLLQQLADAVAADPRALLA